MTIYFDFFEMVGDALHSLISRFSLALFNASIFLEFYMAAFQNLLGGLYDFFPEAPA